MRHVSRTHRIALDWLFDRIDLDPKIQIKCITLEVNQDFVEQLLFLEPCLNRREITILSTYSYFFMVVWHDWSCKEQGRTRPRHRAHATPQGEPSTSWRKTNDNHARPPTSPCQNNGMELSGWNVTGPHKEREIFLSIFLPFRGRQRQSDTCPCPPEVWNSAPSTLAAPGCAVPSATKAQRTVMTELQNNGKSWSENLNGPAMGATAKFMSQPCWLPKQCRLGLF